jgi:hypothetical protein
VDTGAHLYLKFHDNLSSGRQAIPGGQTDEWTGMMKKQFLQLFCEHVQKLKIYLTEHRTFTDPKYSGVSDNLKNTLDA